LKANKIDFGCDIYDAAMEKYSDDNVNVGTENKIDNIDGILYNNTKCTYLFNSLTMIKFFIYKFLFCQLSLVDRLVCVNFAYCKIRTVDLIDRLKEMFPKIKEIDLEGNLFDSWTTVFKILNTFSSLKLVNLRYINLVY
jgi:hypothetical protein